AILAASAGGDRKFVPRGTLFWTVFMDHGDVKAADVWLGQFVAMTRATCPACRKVLELMVGERCPHCRTPVVLGLAAVESYRKAWGICMMGLGAGAGFLTMVAGAFSIQHLRFARYGGVKASMLVTLMVVGVVLWIGLVAGLVGRRRYYRMGALSQ